MGAFDYWYLNVEQMERTVAWLRQRSADYRALFDGLVGDSLALNWQGPVAGRFITDLGDAAAVFSELDAAYAEVADLFERQIRQQVEASAQ